MMPRARLPDVVFPDRRVWRVSRSEQLMLKARKQEPVKAAARDLPFSGLSQPVETDAAPISPPMMLVKIQIVLKQADFARRRVPMSSISGGGRKG